MKSGFAAIPGLPPAKSVPLKERASVVFVGRANLDVIDGALVTINADGSRTQIPVGGITALMLEPGARISHAAIVLCARAGTLVVWVGEGGVRVYSAGNPGAAGTEKFLWQAAIALDPKARIRVVRKMYELRFGERPPEKRSLEQLRGIEGGRVRASYKLMAEQNSVKWEGRKYNKEDWSEADVANQCLSSATASLHALCEAAVLAAGYSPAIGFLHTGSPLSFVYDVSDVWKTRTVVPIAFKIAGRAQRGELHRDPGRAVRIACRDSFRKTSLLEKIIPEIEVMLEASGLKQKRLDGAE